MYRYIKQNLIYGQNIIISILVYSIIIVHLNIYEIYKSVNYNINFQFLNDIQ